ncbi:MAG TPA: VWA domain-containing protein [Pyrinomonadaceae bacterium]|nr:VWA domain-containing protein [Pyrinomonadaceae bacterium]
MHKISRLIITALLCLSSVSAQEKKPPQPQKPEETDDVVRISTELVQTDVMVFDKDGKFVSGLKREQFELLVEGQPQPIAFFDAVVAGSRSELAALRAVRNNKQPQPPAVEEPAAEAASERGRTILFFINDLHISPSSLSTVHKTVKSFIDNMMGPNDQVAITSASGQIGFLQQLTDDKAVLRAALDRLNFVPGAAADSQRPALSEYAAYLIKEQHDRQLLDYFITATLKANSLKDPDDRDIAASMVQQRVETILRNSQVTIKAALSSLVNLMKSTGKVSGRKLVFFISDGFLPNFTGSDFTWMMGRATDSANRSGVVIYSLDARGLSNDSWVDASNAGGFDTSGVLQSRMGGERNFSQEPLHALAADTGGRALLNSNDLEGGIARALDETSRYYLLAWRPTNDAQRASNFSKIKITIAGRPELKVQLRHGYLGASAEPPKAKTDASIVQVESTDVLGVAEFSTEELRTALALGYKQAVGTNMQLNTTLQLTAQSPEHDSGKLEVNVLGAIFDSKGKAVGSFRQRVEVQRTRTQTTPIYTYVNHQVDLPPGLYQVRTIAYERGTTRLTNAMEWIDIPKVKEGAFSISSLYIGEIPEGGANGTVGVNASGHFARNSRLRFTTYIYNAAHTAGAPQLGAQIKILKGDKAVLTPPEAKISTDKATNPANITYTGEFPLSSLPPGNYTLDITVMDKAASASASQQFKFTIY